MTDFIREVDEEVRQDRFRTVLNRYWYVIAAIVALILAGVGAWTAYGYLTTQKAEAAGGTFLNALDLARDGKSDEAVAALKQVEADGTPGYRLLARFRLAGETGAKDPAAAARMFDGIAADPAVDPALQAVAKLRAALLLVDTLPYPELKQRLAPLADPISAVRNAAREMLALAALKAGDHAEAGRQLDAIETDPTTSGALRQRTEALLGLVRGAGEAPPPSAAQAPATPTPPAGPDASPAPTQPVSPTAMPSVPAATPTAPPVPPPSAATPDSTLPETPPSAPLSAPGAVPPPTSPDAAPSSQPSPSPSADKPAVTPPAPAPVPPVKTPSETPAQ